jgi:hypothetical protein
MSSFSPWGGLGEPGEAGVKWGGKESTLGAHTPTRGALPKKARQALEVYYLEEFDEFVGFARTLHTHVFTMCI